MEEAGLPTLMAVDRAVEEHGVSRSTIYLWQSQVRGAPEADWRYWLAPRHVGRQDSAEISTQAWDALVSDYLRPEKPDFTRCARRLRATAKEQGWTLPSDRTLYRRLLALPPELLVLARE
ncbi:MAG: hypothetical protein K2X46_08570, partial [Roseomonas sp.]|nr:hypothetical protein [Roseomonas sp.]